MAGQTPAVHQSGDRSQSLDEVWSPEWAVHAGNGQGVDWQLGQGEVQGIPQRRHTVASTSRRYVAPSLSESSEYYSSAADEVRSLSPPPTPTPTPRWMSIWCESASASGEQLVCFACERPTWLACTRACASLQPPP